VTLNAWASELLNALLPLAARLDATHGTDDYSRAVQTAAFAVKHPETLPSARVLKSITDEFDGGFLAFVQARSAQTKRAMLAQALTDAEHMALSQQTSTSVQQQQEIEAGDSMPFDIYLQEYLSPRRLMTKATSP
jgi:glutamate--cysteine ligase